MSTKTHLFICSPHALQQEAWRALLFNQPGILVAGTLNVPTQLSQQVRPGQANTILIDLPYPQSEIARQFNALAPGIGLLFLVQSFDLSFIIPLLHAGATGFVSYNDSVGELARAIIAVGRGELVLPLEIAIKSLMALSQSFPSSYNKPEPLSERESEVLQLLACGHTNKDIAQELILSVRTVEAHLRSIFAKLGVSSRTEAALWAVQHGYGDPQIK